MTLSLLLLLGCPKPPAIDRAILVSPTAPYTTDSWQEDRFMLSLTARQAVTTRVGLYSTLHAMVGYVDARWDGLTWVYYGGPSAIDDNGDWRLVSLAELSEGRTERPDTIGVEELASSLVGPVLVVLDTCAGGGDRGYGRALSSEAAPIDPVLPDGVVVWAASRPDGRCYTSETGMGLFTSLVVEGLDGAANDTTEGGDSEITLAEASAWVRAEAVERTLGAQVPVVYGDPGFLKAPLARYRDVPVPPAWGQTPRFRDLTKTSEARTAELQRLQAQAEFIRYELDPSSLGSSRYFELLLFTDELNYFASNGSDEASVRALLLAIELNDDMGRTFGDAPPLDMGWEESQNWCYNTNNVTTAGRTAAALQWDEASRRAVRSWDSLRAEVDAAWPAPVSFDLDRCLQVADQRGVAGSEEASAELDAMVERLRSLPEGCIEPVKLEEMIERSTRAARFSDPTHIARIARSLEDWASMWETRCRPPEPEPEPEP